MINTKVKPLNVFKRKFALLKKTRYGNQGIKDPVTREVTGIDVTIIWLEHYWSKLVLNAQRQITEVVLTDDEYFIQVFAPKLNNYLQVRYSEMPATDLTVEMQEKAKLFSRKGISPFDFYTAIYDETPAEFWKKKFAHYASSLILKVAQPYNSFELAQAAYDYFCQTDYDYKHPLDCCDELYTLLTNKKLSMVADDAMPPKWTLK